jgi:hypothetical protein
MKIRFRLFVCFRSVAAAAFRFVPHFRKCARSLFKNVFASAIHIWVKEALLPPTLSYNRGRQRRRLICEIVWGSKENTAEFYSAADNGWPSITMPKSSLFLSLPSLFSSFFSLPSSSFAVSNRGSKEPSRFLSGISWSGSFICLGLIFGQAVRDHR